jgi:hypothetical protein
VGKAWWHELVGGKTTRNQDHAGHGRPSGGSFKKKAMELALPLIARKGGNTINVATSFSAVILADLWLTRNDPERTYHGIVHTYWLELG